MLFNHTKSPFVVHRQYISQNPLDIVGVHCTHGFNRTGFLISAFMIEEHDWSVDAAVQEFRSARAPGIYKGDYLKDIYVRFGLILMLLKSDIMKIIMCVWDVKVI